MPFQVAVQLLIENRTYAFSLFVFGLVYYLVSTWRQAPSIYHQFERLENPWWLPKFLGKGPQTLFAEGYNKIMVPFDRPFVVTWWSLSNLILPPRYLPDLHHFKSEDASFLKNFSDAVRLHYSVGSLYESDRMGDILRKGLNPALPSLTTLIVSEIKRAIDLEIGKPEEWKTFKTVDLFIMISHRVVSRLLAGEELSRDEDFIHLSLKFGDSVFVTGLIISQLPLGPFRGIVGWLIALYHRWMLYRIVRVVEPVIARRMSEARTSKTVPRYDDSIEWAIKLNDPPQRDSRTITLEMLHILEAAAGAPGAMMSEMIYQLLVEPHYFQPLRDEIRDARKGARSTDETIQKLRLMDSFLMETNRMYPVGGVTAARTVMRKPLSLHDGTLLPVGTRIGFPCKAIQLDPANFEDPLRFDGFRFARLNEVEGKDEVGTTRYAAVTPTPTNLSWGFGKHACPGRFYAVKLAKLVFAEILLDYEFQWEGDVQTKHPASFEVEGQFLPNLSQKIRIRKLN
ncbi:cytochrome P450 monooxygenase [Xylaria acuta]|nr:cytochrome P450 monooxygenase [Xylaria acuta]